MHSLKPDHHLFDIAAASNVDRVEEEGEGAGSAGVSSGEELLRDFLGEQIVRCYIYLILKSNFCMHFTGKRPQSFYKGKLTEGMRKALSVKKAKRQVTQGVQRGKTLGKLIHF